MRRGLGIGQGKGYRNMIPHDRPVHRDSGKGIKQAQFIPNMNFRPATLQLGWYDGALLTPEQYSALQEQINNDYGERYFKLKPEYRMMYVRNFIKKNYPKKEWAFMVDGKLVRCNPDLKPMKTAKDRKEYMRDYMRQRRAKECRREWMKNYMRKYRAK